MAEIKIMHRNETSYSVSRRVTPTRFQLQSLSLLHMKNDYKRAFFSTILIDRNDLKWPLTPYLKENFPTASSSDPCQSDLDCRWGSKSLLILLTSTGQLPMQYTPLFFGKKGQHLISMSVPSCHHQQLDLFDCKPSLHVLIVNNFSRRESCM